MVNTSEARKVSALDEAFRFHQEAKQEGDFVKYERAAYYYRVAGEFTKAEACTMAAERLKNEQTH